MKFQVLSIILLTCLFSCKEQEEKLQTRQQNLEENGNITDSIGPPRETTIPTRECYLYAKNYDTITLNLEKSHNRITGNLAYLWAEKDRNTGKISGIMRGDTIFADYTFISEGKESVREVVFLKKEDKLIEGYAPVTQENEKTIFKNNEFDFDKSFVLTRTDCKI